MVERLKLASELLGQNLEARTNTGQKPLEAFNTQRLSQRTFDILPGKSKEVLNRMKL